MQECTNPQYIISATDPNYSTEYYSVTPGGPPVLVNQIPPGQPTINAANEQEKIQAISKLLSEKGFCKMPESLDATAVQEVEDTSSEGSVPSGIAALEENMARRNEETIQAVEEVQATPDIYYQKTESLDSVGPGGSVAVAVIGIPVTVALGKIALSQIQQRMFPVESNQVANNYESEIPENIYTPAQPAAPVASAVVPEPSPWTRPPVHAGNPYQASHFGRNEVPKSVRNESEMSRNGFRNEPKSPEMTSEMSLISPEMAPVDSERLERVRQRLSGLFEKSESIGTQAISDEMDSEMKMISDEPKSISGYFDPSGDLTQAKAVYFQLRSQGISKAVDLGGAIFGIRGGDKWSSVSPILQSWSNEWEMTNG